MRKPRVIIFDDQLYVLDMLKDFFLMRGYEVLSFSDPKDMCHLYSDGADICRNEHPCGDIMITDFQAEGKNGADMIVFQAGKGCKLDARNKTVIADRLYDEGGQRADEHGYNVLQRPFTLYAMSEWLDACEKRMDLMEPLATRRKEMRNESRSEVTFTINSDTQLYAGTAVNTSPSGLCIRIPSPLQREDIIKLHVDGFHSCQRATVRWVKQIDKNTYIAGISCV